MDRIFNSKSSRSYCILLGHLWILLFHLRRLWHSIRALGLVRVGLKIGSLLNLFLIYSKVLEDRVYFLWDLKQMNEVFQMFMIKVHFTFILSLHDYQQRIVLMWVYSYYLSIYSNIMDYLLIYLIFLLFTIFLGLQNTHHLQA